MIRTDRIEPDRSGILAASRSGSIPTPAAAFNAAFCERVAAARRAAGLTQLQVADALGMPQRSYQHFEGRSPLPVHLIVPFADLVGIDVRELLTGE
jgi:DNA-binding XRE family transcriptional regulator